VIRSSGKSRLKKKGFYITSSVLSIPTHSDLDMHINLLEISQMQEGVYMSRANTRHVQDEETLLEKGN
jgi:hypothetical protein